MRIAWLIIVAGCASVADPEPKGGGDDGNGSGSDGSGSDGSGSDRSCTLQSGIGVEGAMVVLGSRNVTFHDWITKPGETDVIGFSITIDGADSLGYVVKAGPDRFHSTATTFLNTATPARGIGSVDFCEN